MKYVLTKPSVRAGPPVAFSALAAARATFPGHWLLEAWGLQLYWLSMSTGIEIFDIGGAASNSRYMYW